MSLAVPFIIIFIVKTHRDGFHKKKSIIAIAIAIAIARLLDTELFIIITCKHCLGSQKCTQLYS